jgi:tetratricopeptide (TPR) repeat protein
MPEVNPPSSPDMFFAESWLAMHYMLRMPERAPQLRNYLLALRNGEDDVTAFTASFGMDFDAFGKALQDYANKGMTYTRLQWTPPPVGPITVTLLPASADRIVKLRARLLSDAVSSGDKAEFINKVRTEAASFPDDPLALRTLARAEVFYGDVQKADAALDHLLAIKPDDAEALYLKGVRTIHDVSTSPQDIQAIYAKARAFFAKAYRADPNNYQSLYLYAYTLLYGGAKPTQNTLNVIMAAHQLAPQVDEITYEAARALKAAGIEDEAVPLLRSIAYKPHPTWMSDAALNALYADGKQYDRAIRDYAAAIGRAPKNPRLYVNRGNVYASANHPDLALQDFAQARALSSKDAIALNNLCWAQATHGLALEAALKDCDAALAMDPKSSATFDSRGFVNLRLGQFAAAVADYTAALKSRPDVPTSLYGRALAERQLGQTEAAQKDLAAALTAAPDVASEFEAYGVK